MLKFISNPVVIEAEQFTGDHTPDCLFGVTLGSDGLLRGMVKTLEGMMTAIQGDWIIKGTEGERYPCKEVVFAKKYKPYEEEKNVLKDNASRADWKRSRTQAHTKPDGGNEP